MPFTMRRIPIKIAPKEINVRGMFVSIMAITLFISCGSDNKTTNNEVQEITITISPSRALVDFGDTIQFLADVSGTNDDAVNWYVGGVAGGDAIHGVVDSAGNYAAPISEVPDADSVTIEARLISDSTKAGRGWIILVNPGTIYVDMLGSDSTGVGSLHRPYRSITRALARAYAGQQILVGAGQFDVSSGEQFPLVVPPMVTLQGAGPDSTFVFGPGGFDYSDALIQADGDAITVDGFNIESSILNGVGVWLRPGRYTSIGNCRISNCYIGIYVNGPGLPRPIIDNIRLDSDSIGIATADSSAPLIRNSVVKRCYKYGIYVGDMSEPDLGDGQSGGAGNNSIDSCGINNSNFWLVYNGTPNTIFAVGNHWPFELPSSNDPYIFDDDESDSSGQVLLEWLY